MATAKEYEILFMLKAQMDSAFGTGFTSARTYLSQLQGQVKEYNSVLRDISSYQKHTQALETLKDKLDTEKKALADTEAKIKSNGGATKELTAEKEKHERAIAKLEEKIASQTSKLEEEKKVLQGEKVDVDNLAQSEADLKDKVEATTQEMQDFVSLQNGITDLANAFGTLKVAADTVANASNAAYEAVNACIESAAELEYTMSAVEAVSGATEDQTAELTALAKEMGATTVYTASQCAEALQTEALAGWSVEEMLAGLPAVVNMAAASGESLTEMTSIVSDSLNAFGLSGEAAVTKFADVLTTAATSSNTTVSVLGESLSYVESSAANLGYSIEDVSVALAVMANNALKGSVSGSALNTMLTRMSGANSNAAGAMEELGISMYYADGSAKDLLTFMEELRDAFKQFGDDSQSAQIAAYKLAGQRGMRGLLSIVNTTDEEWQQMVEDIYDYEGAADAVSDIRLDNYQGQIYLLESAWDALKTTVGEGFLPVATDAAGVLTDLCNVANEWAGENQELVVGLSAAASAAGIVAVGISGIATALQFAKFAMATFMPGLGTVAAVAASVGVAVAALVGPIAAYKTSVSEATEETKAFKEAADSLVEQAQTTQNSYEETTTYYDEQRSEALSLIGVLDSLNTTGNQTELSQWQIANAVSKLNELLPGLNLQYSALTGTLNMTTEEMEAFANTASDDEINEKVALYNQLVAEQKDLYNQKAEAKERYAEATSEAADEALKRAQEAGDYGGSSWTSSTPQLAGEAATAKEAYEEIEEEYNSHAEAIKSLREELQGYIDTQSDAADATELTSEMMEEITEYAQAYGEAWSEAYENAASSLEGQLGLMKEVEEAEDPTYMSDLQTNLDDQLKMVQDYQSNLETIFSAAETNGIDISPILEDLTDGSTDAMTAAQAIADSVNSGSTDALQNLSDTAASVQTTTEEIKSAIADQQPEVQSAYDAMMDGIDLTDEDLKAQAAQAALEIVQGYIDGFTSGEESVSAAAESSGEDVAQGLANGMTDTESATAAATSLGNAAIDALNAALGVASPSTITYTSGENTDQGLINGMDAKQEAAAAKATAVGSATATAFKNELKQSDFKSYGINAIQGAINGINDKKKDLVAAAKAAASAANQAYHDESQIGSPSRLYYYYSEMNVAGGVQGWNANQYKLEQAAAEAAAGSAETFSSAVQSGTTVNLTGYASGTNNASAGLKMVGENGPELVNFSGGETVYNNRETTRIIGAATESSGDSSGSGSVIQVTYAPNITITGNADETTLKEALSTHNQELLDIIEEYLTEREASQRRRSY